MPGRQRGPAAARSVLIQGTGQRIAVEPRQQFGSIDDVLNRMAEAEFQAAHVVKVLRDHGWIVTTVPDMRRTEAGWPDVVAWRPNLPGLLLAWELKVKGRRPRPAQRRTLEHLRTVPGVDARVVEPKDWPQLRDVLLDTSSDVRAALAAIKEQGR